MSEKKRFTKFNQQHQKRDKLFRDNLVDIYLRLKMKKERDSNDQTVNSYIDEKEELSS